MKKIILCFFAFFSFNIYSQSLDYQGLRKKILEPYCLRCHSGPAAPHGLDYSTYNSTVKNPSHQIIVPGMPLKSLFYTVIESGVMPRGGPMLSDEEIQFVFDWIEKGAVENQLGKSI